MVARDTLHWILKGTVSPWLGREAAGQYKHHRWNWNRDSGAQVEDMAFSATRLLSFLGRMLVDKAGRIGWDWNSMGSSPLGSLMWIPGCCQLFPSLQLCFSDLSQFDQIATVNLGQAISLPIEWLTGRHSLKSSGRSRRARASEWTVQWTGVTLELWESNRCHPTVMLQKCWPHSMLGCLSLGPRDERDFWYWWSRLQSLLG